MWFQNGTTDVSQVTPAKKKKKFLPWINTSQFWISRSPWSVLLKGNFLGGPGRSWKIQQKHTKNLDCLTETQKGERNSSLR